jgi:c-di-GMP-binding flagellar brake protein YcgR
MIFFTAALIVFLILLAGAGVTFLIFFIRSRNKVNKSISIVKSCSAIERRRALRSIMPCRAVIRRNSAGNDRSIKEFEIRDISNGGSYIYTDRSFPLDLGEEIDVTIELGRSEYYKGKARVVHSQAVFDNNSEITESGIGIRFLLPTNEKIRIKQLF